MGRHDRPDDMRFSEDDRDSAIAELLRRAYARKVDVDIAARHLWAIDTAARARREAARTGRSRRAVLAVLTSFMLALTSGAAVAASTVALPGDALYSVKRGTERVRLVLAVRPETDAEVRLAIARQRWEEVQEAAAARPRVVPGLLKDTFAALEAAERGGAAAAVLALRTEVTAGSGELAFGPSIDSAPAGDTSEATPGDVAPGDVASGDVAPGDVASGDGPAREPADDETTDGADADTAGDGDAAETADSADAAVPSTPSAPSAPSTPSTPSTPPGTAGQPQAPPVPATTPPSPTMAATPPEEPAPTGPSSGDNPAPTGGTEEPGGSPSAEPVPQAPSQPAPATTGEQPAPDQPPPAATAPGWGRAQP